jgi:hypothetical protein
MTSIITVKSQPSGSSLSGKPLILSVKTFENGKEVSNQLVPSGKTFTLHVWETRKIVIEEIEFEL